MKLRIATLLLLCLSASMCAVLYRPQEAPEERETVAPVVNAAAVETVESDGAVADAPAVEALDDGGPPGAEEAVAAEHVADQTEDVPEAAVPAAEEEPSDEKVAEEPAADDPAVAEEPEMNSPLVGPDTDATVGEDVPAADEPVAADVPEPDVPATDVLEAVVPEVDVPAAAADVPEADVPEADGPEAVALESDVPAEADVPATDVPAADVPATDVPEADVPIVEVPEADVPIVEEVPEPDVPEAEVPEEDVPVAEVLQSDVPEPDVPEPDVPEPDVPEPDVPAVDAELDAEDVTDEELGQMMQALEEMDHAFGTSDDEEEESSWGFGSVRSGFQALNGYFSSLVEMVGGKDGVCQYRCKDGETPQPRPDFQMPEPDGCTNPLMGFQIDLGVPAMTKCCDQLDMCYDTCGTSKYRCDSKFRWCMHGICSDLKKSLGFVSKVQACESMADVLYKSVSTLGCNPYMNSQRAACYCEDETRDEL